MKTVLLLKFAFIACLLGVTVSLANVPRSGDNGDRKGGKRSGKSGQVGFSAIVVNGRNLTGPNSAAQTRDGRLMMPISSLARALGDTVSTNASEQTVTVRRQSGTSATFFVQKGEITENGAVVLSISSKGELAFTPFVEEILLPIEIVAMLFDAAIRFDQIKNVVIVTRGVTGLVSKKKRKRGVAELYQAGYEYNLSRYGSSASSYLMINAVGRFADGRFDLRSYGSGASYANFLRKSFTFDLERPNGQRYSAGDIGSGTALPLLTANVRGGSASIPVGDLTFTAFGGRSSSGSFTRDNTIDPETAGSGKPPFDTNVFGGYVTTKFDAHGKLNPITFSAGAMKFGGRARSGTVASTSANFVTDRIQLQADFGVGTFHGTSADEQNVDGSAIALDVSTTIKATSDLSLYGRYANIGANFLSPQEGFREPINLFAGGVSWSPVRWITSSVTASMARRPGKKNSSENFVSTSFVISPGAGRPQFYVSHTQSWSEFNRNGQFTLLNVSQSFRRTRFYANATRIKNSGPASSQLQLGSNILINERNSLEISQGLASQKNFNGLAEWRTDRWLNGRLAMTAGFGYNYSPTAGARAYEKVTGSLGLPRGTSLQASYIHTTGGQTLLVQVRGTFFRRRDAATYMYASMDDVNNYARVSGRVYQDIDSNGKYDAGVDKPQSSVKVRIDGARFAETDVNGLFSFEAVQAGDHKIHVDLLSVRADLTLLDGGTRDLNLETGQHVQLDFRLARTGRITGRVFFDKNEDGAFNEGDTALSDVRIVTSSGRDTLTDGDGFYTIADLAPGEHVILVDEKTLPEKTRPGVERRAMQIFAGRETSEVDLMIVPIPAEIKVFGGKSP